MSLLAGCYERFLFGYQLEGEVQGDAAEGEQKLGLHRSFTHAAHKGVVKCVAAAGQWGATGGADDLIHLYDLKSDKDLGFLMSPGEGAVTALAFFAPAGAYNPTHLLSGSADGSVSVWQAGGGWECLKTMRGHRKDVAAISVHPSGLLALTVSRDGFMRMWDLVKGRCTYHVRLEVEAEGVEFCREDGGARYALLCGARLTVHGVQGDAGVLCTLSHPGRTLCMAWAPGNRIVSGCEDGSLRLWDAQAGVELLCISRAHVSRVRTLALLPPSSAGGRLLAATGSSDGSLKLWDLTKAAAAGVHGSSGGSCLAEAQTRARLTCMAAADLPAIMQQRVQQAAAAARQAAAAQAQAPAQKQQGKQQQQQQQRQQQQGKRKATDAAGANGSQQQQQGAGPAKKKPAQQQGRQAAGQQGGGKAKGGEGGKAKQGGKAAEAERVVVKDGVVEFLGSPAEQKKQAAAKRHKQAAQQDQRFRSVPVPNQQLQAGARQKQRPPKQRK
ncbi:hypothetical protein CHLNCDRAFT_133558 [Chlorella variabilis]|uniref:Uncharacterized protein n=1 Tax=Chlorella variabilis TaxID=554065 RepID=E1Z3C2_CHLVA|nr:hypothetical protein CHLNCDRAFT_133558 [Chlorella variabilis]EFN60143.1 hypothetical protein CHLNCDRAFT_133558 [Chlorella variabilis]|eukprot:XP_005852245.1 hypothetical protein CHLNCDRAFT_133558 [Chlorella variabilis]